MLESRAIGKSIGDLSGNSDGHVLIAPPDQPFEYIWIIDSWESQSIDPISPDFIINDLAFHMQACRPKQPSQFFSVKVILVEKPPGPKTFRFTVEISNDLFPEKSVLKRSSKAFSRINAYETFTLLPSHKITEKDGFLKDGQLTIIFKYAPNSIKPPRSIDNNSVQPPTQIPSKEQSQTPQTTEQQNTNAEQFSRLKSSSMVFTPAESIIPIASKFSGLRNQGATCYMNSILQVLYHIPSFRRIVYSMPTTGNEDITTSIPLNLQSLFCRMQFTNSACSTTDLTRSFGWDRSYTTRQHDVVEFERALIQNLEAKIKDTELSGHISSQFIGKIRTSIKCKNVNFVHSIDEDFDNLPLIVRGCKNLDESLKKELESQDLTGSDQYKTEEYGSQDAIMETEFISFPPILHIQLRRFEHDNQTNRNIKINDRFEYPSEIDLTPYLSPSSEQFKRNNTYLLFAIIVHSGSIASGHYYCYIRPNFDDQQWYKFDDANVTTANLSDVLANNFGGPSSTLPSSQNKTYSAYMLIYVRKEEMTSLFEPVTDESVPIHIRESAAQNDLKNKSEVPPDYIDIRLNSEASIRINSMRWMTGFHNNATMLVMRLNSDEKVASFYEKVADWMKKKVDQIRLWKCSTYLIPETPILVENEDEKLSDIFDKGANVFAQRIFPEEGEKVDVESDKRVMFFKFFFLPRRNPNQSENQQTNSSENQQSSQYEISQSSTQNESKVQPLDQNENQSSNTCNSQSLISSENQQSNKSETLNSSENQQLSTSENQQLSTSENQPLNSNAGQTSSSSMSSNLRLGQFGDLSASSVKSQSPDLRFEATIRYIGSRAVRKSLPVSELFPIVNAIVGLPTDTPLIVFQETIQHSAQLISEPQDTLVIDAGSMLIFQISPGIEIEDPDPAQFDPLADSNVPLQSMSSSGFFDPLWSNLPIVSYFSLHPDLAPTTTDQYMNHKLRTLESVMFDYDDKTVTGKAIVRFPSNLSWPALKRLISIAVKCDYDPEHDSMRIYKRDTMTGGPSKFPISMRFSHSIASSLVGSTPKKGDRLHLFYSIIHGIPESMLMNMANYNVQYSEDGFSVSVSARLLIMKNSTLRKVAFEMQNRGILPQSDSIRVLQVFNKRIVRLFEKVDDQVVTDYNSILRFENIPIEQRSFDEDVNVYCPVSQGYVDFSDKPHFVGDPFLFMCNVGDTLGAIRRDLIKWAEVPVEQVDFAVVMRLRQCSDQLFVVEPIRDDAVVSDIIRKGDQIFIWQPKLEDVKEEENARVTFVDHPPPRKKEAREREQPVKIFN
ncbi:hypothetical protein M9Y10_023077 [Tritrichomonas musculus]|uniref:ubiquitinyl hydrolase 1 n=1 Tax=Tritrichomonas musculus TaxID=1915356 RepID=A0ABR2KU28_9EUKA